MAKSVFQNETLVNGISKNVEFSLKTSMYRLKQVHNFIVRGSNLILKISVFGIETADRGRTGFINLLY